MADNVDPDPPPPPPDAVVATQPITPIPPAAPPPHEGCMAKRSTLEKILLVIVIIILIICLGFIAAFFVFYYFTTPLEGTCLTEHCVKAASRLRSYMDESVAPCNDFYQYACGGWIKSQALDPHETRIGLESTISDRNRIRIRAKQSERDGEPFLKLLTSVGKFPSLDDFWNETDFNLDDLVIKLAKLIVMPLFTIDVRRDLVTTSVNRFYISDASLGLDSAQKYKNGRNDTWVRSYEKWLVDNLVFLGANRSVAEQDIREVVDLEIRIAKLIRSDIEKGDISTRNNQMSIAALQSEYPWDWAMFGTDITELFKWLEFFQAIGSAPGVGVYISLDEQIINSEPDYFKKLGVVVSNTTKRVLTNYLMSHLIPFTSALGSKFVDLLDQFSRETQGTEPRPRFERCVSEAASVFPESVSRMYVEKYFPKEAKVYMTEMITDIKSSFSSILDESKWMTDSTRQKAHGKLKSMGSKVGYPDYIIDDERLNKLYTMIPTKEDEYMETLVACRTINMLERIKVLREAKDNIKWPVHAAVVNAHYDILANEIIFPAAFLQEPVYSSGYPSSMNYGAIGMIIGHEITHGFDNTGSQYNASGSLSNWWTTTDAESFKSRTECFVDQYGCYKWDGLSLDGQRTLSENIADNGGLKQSFKAYRNFIRRLGSEEPWLPGLKLNHNQVFFLSFAQVWCSKYREEHKKQVIESDTHTPSMYRVFGTLQNSQEFADTFKCSQGSRMNPQRKCVLW